MIPSPALLTPGAGTSGIPLPYTPGTDDALAVVLLCCFLMSSYVLSRSRKFLVQLGRDYLLNRERTSIFASSTAADMRYMLLLLVQPCVLGGVYIFNCCVQQSPALVEHVEPLHLLGFYVGASLLYLFAKWVLYSLLGWIFFDTGRSTLWMESYSTLLYYIGFAMFPLVLAAVYFDVSLSFTLIAGVVLLAFAKILMLYKWIKLFCNNLYGCFLLILYFCALEIVPCPILYRVLMELNEYLLIKI